MFARLSIQIANIDFNTFDFIRNSLKSLLLLFQLGFNMFEMTSIFCLVETYFFRQTANVLFNLIKALINLIKTTFHLFKTLIYLEVYVLYK